MALATPILDFRSPKAVQVDGLKVNYLCYEPPGVSGQIPVVILGGVFQKLESFRRDVELFGREHPVYLVDLPGQGGNTDIVPEMDFGDLADILKGFMDEMGLERIVPLAMSLGSAVGYMFALKYPQRTHRLMLAGIAPELRASVRRLLRRSLDILAADRMDEFATAVVLHLMNYPRRDQMPGSVRLARGIHRNMSRLSGVDRLKYTQNVERLLAYDRLPDQGPACETVVIAGAWDSFTTPREGFLVSQRCPNSVFLAIERGDHLTPYIRKDTFINTCLDFLRGERLVTSADLTVYGDGYNRCRRQTGQRIVVAKPARIEYPDGSRIKVVVNNINAYGCLMDVSRGQDQLWHGKGGIICMDGAPVAPCLLPVREADNQVGALFMSREVEEMAQMEAYVRALAG